MVKDFFCGHMSRFLTHTNLELLPKKVDVKSFSYLRPISLNNFTNKIISRLVHERIVRVVLRMIFPNKTGFIKGRSITENVVLGQEIIRDIRIRHKWHNVLVKLDMTKAYDRVFWPFLTKVIRKFGFPETIIDMVWRILSNNWYSILIYGQSYRFFKSSRELKKRGSIIPYLIYYNCRSSKWRPEQIT